MGKIEMGEDEDSDKNEMAQHPLRKLMQGYGVREDNLRAVLTPDLIGDFRIKRSDSPQQIRKKVSDLLEQLIKPLTRENQQIARYSFSITGLDEIERIKTLGRRQLELDKREGIAKRTSQKALTEVILPNLDEQLRARRQKGRLVLIGGGAAVLAAIAAVVLVTTLNTGDDPWRQCLWGG